MKNTIASKYDMKTYWHSVNCKDKECKDCQHFRKGCTKSGYPGILYTKEVINRLAIKTRLNQKRGEVKCTKDMLLLLHL